jgi:hypothetical protein
VSWTYHLILIKDQTINQIFWGLLKKRISEKLHLIIQLITISHPKKVGFPGMIGCFQKSLTRMFLMILIWKSSLKIYKLNLNHHLKITKLW